MRANGVCQSGNPVVLASVKDPPPGRRQGGDSLFCPASVSRVLIMAEGLAGLLRWYADMGVDIAVDGVPHDRFAESRAGVCLRAETRSLSAARPETIEAGRRGMLHPAAVPAGHRARGTPPPKTSPICAKNFRASTAAA